MPVIKGSGPLSGTLPAAQGNQNAQEARDYLATKLTPDQIAEAQRMAREWMEKHQQ